MMINETHDPNLKSWVDSANDPDTDFPIQNLPYCRIADYPDAVSTIAIGDQLLEINPRTAEAMGLDLFFADDTNRLPPGGYRMSYGLMRKKISESLSIHASPETREVLTWSLSPQSEAKFLSVFEIGDYTDFYCSIYHATNVGSMFRPDNPLMPNYK